MYHSAHSHTSIYTQNNKRKLELCGNWLYHHRHFCTGHVYSAVSLGPSFPHTQIKPLSTDDGNLRTVLHPVFLLSLIGLTSWNLSSMLATNTRTQYFKKKIVLCCHLGAIIPHTFLFRLPQGSFKAMYFRGRR